MVEQKSEAMVVDTKTTEEVFKDVDEDMELDDEEKKELTQFETINKP